MTDILQVPTHIISGFLGVGKTTTIIDLFRQKPAQQKWAVLVNEFGKLGIDQYIYRAQNIEVQEIPGGCMCCAQGVALQVAINKLLRQTRPDRLIIESSGVGHPAGVLKMLNGDGFKKSLQLKATICLIDPMHLLIAKYRKNELFRQQIEYADILLANKSDIATTEALQAFDALVQSFHPPKQLASTTQHGHASLDWLELDHQSQPTHFSFQPRALQPALCETPDSGYQTHSIQFDSKIIFDFKRLKKWLNSLQITRAKGTLQTERGFILVNLTEHQLELTPINQLQFSNSSNRIEFIASQLEPMALENALKSCIKKPAPV
jgi:G3E family GTPase